MRTANLLPTFLNEELRMGSPLNRRDVCDFRMADSSDHHVRVRRRMRVRVCARFPSSGRNTAFVVVASVAKRGVRFRQSPSDEV